MPAEQKNDIHICYYSLQFAALYLTILQSSPISNG